ncbi:MAG: hypothetical protein ACI9D0_000209 [Bacteroidia bacterium]|jgi:hypothetical protein
MSTKVILRSFLGSQAAMIKADGLEWLDAASDEIASCGLEGMDDTRFGALLSIASRKLGHAAKRSWSLSNSEVESAGLLRDGWDPSYWTPLEAARVHLVLSRMDLDLESGAKAIESAFRFADENELCALYRSLAHLPDGKRFLWRAAEGCRTNMVSVFEADVLDTPFPAEHFDALAFNQAVIKALFVGVPLCRLWSLDRRLSPDLARMALDLADERRSAGRDISPDLWLCLGTFAGERGLAALELEITRAASLSDEEALFGARAAVLALGRAGATDRLRELIAAGDPVLAPEAELALGGDAMQHSWSRFVAPTLC